jgi:hypothetical protein
VDAISKLSLADTCELKSYSKNHYFINPLTPELNPSAQRCLTRLYTGDFAS